MGQAVRLASNFVVLDDGDEQVIEIMNIIARSHLADLRIPQVGHYAISGEFGTVSLVADRLITRLEGP